MKWIDELGAELPGAASLDAATGLFVDSAFRELGVSATDMVPLFQGADPASEADARQGWFGLDAVAHALRVGLPQPCGLFDELGRAIWLNEAAENEVGLRAMRTADGVLLPAHRPELTAWSDAVIAAARRSNDHEPYSFSGMSVRRIEQRRLPSLFLVTVESSSAACLRQLSARERQIAELAARGYSVLNVAHQLGIAEGTTRNHLKRIYRKLGVCSRVDLARRVWGA